MRTANPTNNPTTLPVLEKKDFEFSCAEGLGGSTDWFEVGTAVTVVTLPSDVVTVLIIADEVFEGVVVLEEDESVDFVLVEVNYIGNQVSTHILLYYIQETVVLV